ncbi:M23 family metallopeptidase [Leifsonia shinshuensis]|uniref:M23 family metallopeptidase n=2 Tax=Leifsonia shinshuensis TaxID=150026 RepID=A0A7G6YGC9_9MICO|nr:M23 family metallopeptidase [Leifsonia shinshuensis]
MGVVVATGALAPAAAESGGYTVGGRAASGVADAAASPIPGDTALARPRASARWSWPLSPPRVVGAYAAPPSPYAAGHRGIDLAARPGATVTAPSDATVHFVGVVVDRPVLTLDHGSGVLSSYEPLAAAGLAVGDRVTRGMPLGVVGEGAHCSGACLHVGVRVDGEYASPLLFFERLPRSVLLPLHAGRASPASAGGRPAAPRGRPAGPCRQARGWAMR